MSLLLNIETSTKVCSVSLAENGKEIALKEECPESFVHAEKLNIFIETLFEDTGYSIDQLDAICVSKGPGSFTGLRIGIATAKGLCYALNIPLLSIDSLTILAQHFLQKNEVSEGTLLLPMIDARRMEVYTAIFNTELQIQDNISAKIIDQNSYIETNQPLHIFGDGADKCSEVLDRDNITIYPNIETSASGMCNISYQKFLKKEFEDLAYFDPFYLKDFVAGVKGQSN